MTKYQKTSKSIFLALLITLNFGLIGPVAAVTAETNVSVEQTASSTFMSAGKASWYAYKGGMFAASPDFIAGTQLKVTSASDPTNSIVVTVNDYGPDRNIHPDRVIDLDKVAFAKLASLGAGVIDVTIEPILKDKVQSDVTATTATTTSINFSTDYSRLTVLATRVDLGSGELWQDNKTGGVYFITSSTKQALTDRVFLNTIFKGKKIVSKTPATLAKLKTLAPIVFPNGYLIKTAKDSSVYLVYNNEKKAFLNGDTFEKLGYAWSDVVVVPDKVINNYKNGLILNLTNQADSNTVTEQLPETVTPVITPEINVSSKAAVILDESSGKVIYAKNSSEQLPLASLSKMVALKVFLDTKPDLNKVVTYKVQDENYNYAYASKSELARLTVSDGETMTIRDLLYSSLLGSANNAVESLVRVSSLSRQAFIQRMNDYAKIVGATQTKFVEPTGLSPENVSSAMDYALITKAVLADGNLEKVSMTKNYSFTTINTKKTHYIKNSNSLFFTSNLNITGSKTGYLDEALYCLMTRAKDSSGHEIIAVTLGTPTRAASFSEMEKLINYGLNF